MFRKWTFKNTLLLLLAVGMLGLPACSAATPTAVAQPTQPPALPTQVEPPTAVPPTATSEPTATATPEPTATPVPPTPTNTPIPPDQQVTTWCIPKEKAIYIKASEDPAIMPEGGQAGKLEKDTIGMVTPAVSCTFVFNLGAPVPDGAILQVLDGMDQIWLKAVVNPSPKNPNISYAVLTHAYIVEPPFWTIVYKVQLKSGDATLWSGKIDMHRSWMPALCWDGTLPDVKKLTCRKQQDLHPWDPGYWYTPPPPTPVP